MQVWRVLRSTIDGFIRDDCPSLAAGLAFYTLFSLAPLLVIVVNLTAVVVDADAISRYIVDQAGSLVGNAGAEQVSGILEVASRQGRDGQLASIVSGVLVIVGATTVLVQLQRALNQVWQVTPKPGIHVGRFVVKRLVSLAMMLILAFLLVVSLFASALLGAASSWLSGWLPPSLGSPAGTAIDLGTSFLVFGLVFSALFKYLPDAEITWRQVAVGGTVTSALFVVGKLVIGRFIGGSMIATLYGAAGSLAVVLVWVYYTAILVLFGAELSRAVAHSRGESPEPATYARSDTRRILQRKRWRIRSPNQRRKP